ncbi:4-aminobutyrate--2-oxoglutarate transaminase [Geomonas paludis]|uniref:4-aminobutyrate--2-oxoglutarate transaminase n=1 Tax=Geomonas paludis TaxID=2740185 RepID=A0A6V8MW56_9BACT|nr:4-aminobutyrate--2-oxoglutarate transaminase [Geomonas paludis]UPU34122.1 4-aminobutyrate--2-oxoglutarate transaminase [Geomonas paludis]GFO64094.1 4-aminobutyrate--2-oxoglutarate transaminase [Geomonas paludis]
MRTPEVSQALRNKHVPPGVSILSPSFVKEARGAIIVDTEGREFIDFAGGIGVANVGHCHPKVVAAVKDQAEKFLHTCFHIVPYDLYIDLAARLNELAPGDGDKMTIFLNSGAEAVENAIKIARHATGRPSVIAFENGFHGRTNLTMTLTSKVKPYKLGFGPFAPEIYRMPYAYCYRCPFGLKHPGCNTACAEHLEEFFISHVAAEKTAAVIAEPIQGEGGFVTPPAEYFPKLRDICDKHGIMLIIDEVQTGMGRTGKLFAIDHWGVVPDLVTTAKSLGGGLPISAVTGKAEVMSAPHVGGLGGTYGGNPIALAAAQAVLEIFTTDGLLARAEELGVKMRARFYEMQKRHEIIGEVRGKGPMLALELVRDRESKEPAAAEAKKLVNLCYQKGLVVLSCGNHGNVIRTLMPLVITDAELERGMSILEESLQELRG